MPGLTHLASKLHPNGVTALLLELALDKLVQDAGLAGPGRADHQELEEVVVGVRHRHDQVCKVPEYGSISGDLGGINATTRALGSDILDHQDKTL